MEIQPSGEINGIGVCSKPERLRVQEVLEDRHGAVIGAKLAKACTHTYQDTASREAFLDAVAHGSAVAWQHLNLLGEYDFSDEKLLTSIGGKLRLIIGEKTTFGVGQAQVRNPLSVPRQPA